MSDTLVQFEKDGDVAIVTMDDGKANALSYAMMESLDAAITRAESEAAVLVLAGRAGRFCAGFDLREMAAGMDRARALVSRGAEFLLRLYGLQMPLVIACSGHALAGGALTVLTGDVRVGVGVESVEARARELGLGIGERGRGRATVDEELASDALRFGGRRELALRRLESNVGFLHALPGLR